MAEKDVIIKEKLKYTGYGDFKDIYNYVYDWLKGELYSVTEDTYVEKIKGSSKELDISWKAAKKITDYFKVEMDVKWKVLGMEDVEVDVDGKKKKMNKFAEIKIEFKGSLIKDYTNQWNQSATTKFFKEIYNKYVIPSRTSQMEDKIEDDVKNLKEEIKAFLDLTGKR